MIEANKVASCETSQMSNINSGERGERDRSIDIAKGIAMLMVIWMHCINNLSNVPELY